MTQQETVANCVHTLRTQAKKTQEEVARSVGVTRQTIIAVEKGNYTPSVVLALKIAHFFHKSVDDVFYLEQI